MLQTAKPNTIFVIHIQCNGIQSTLVNPTYSVPTLGLSDYEGVGIMR